MRINTDFVVMVRRTHHERHCILSLRRELSRTLVEGSVERLSGYTLKNYQGKSARICVLFNDAVQNFLLLFRGKLLSVKTKKYFLLYIIHAGIWISILY